MFDKRQGVAVVTGGSGGIGAEVCRLLSDRGCDVALTYNRNAERAEAVVDSVERRGRKARAWQVNLADEEQAAAFVNDAAETFGGIHTLVYASGPHVPQVHLSKIAPATYRQQMTDDAVAFFNLAHPAIPHLRPTRGNVVAVSTVAIRRYPVKDVLSAAPKGAVEATVRAIAAEEGRFGVRANCVGTGILGEGMTARLLHNNEITQAELDMTTGAIALRRLGTVNDVAEAVCFLASDRAAYITGQTLDVDGGYRI